MFLKFETTFNVYEHKSKTILCRVKVLTKNYNNSKNASSLTNTCRLMTTDQWNKFDEQLISWVEHNENNVFEGEEPELHGFVVTPNLQINIKKCNMGFQDFLKCLNTDNDNCYGATNKSNSKYGFPYVLDCILEHTSMAATRPTSNTEEYEPLPTTSINNSLSISPVSYAPYTPSKRTRRFHSECHVKASCYDIAVDDVVDDMYSPKPIVKNANITDVAQYKPAPICKRSNSFESQVSYQNDVIVETEDELIPYEGYRTIRQRLKSKTKKTVGEYVPQTSIIENDIPAYKPSPIETVAKTENKLNPNDGKPINVQKPETANNEKIKSPGDSKPSKEHKKKEKHHSKEYAGENANKRSLKEKLMSSTKESKKSLNSSCSSEDIFEAVLDQPKAKSKDAEKYKGKDRTDFAKDKNQSSRYKHKDKSDTKLKKPSNDGEDKTNNSEKLDIPGKHRRQKDKDKEKNKSNEREEVTESYKNKSLDKPKNVPNKLMAASLIRRSERSPTKPKRFIEEQEKYEHQKKDKMNRLTPLKNKELFGTDDDDEDDDSQNQSDKNNNGCDVNSPPQNTKTDKKVSLSMSAIPSSASKKKRHRSNCEQEKAGMTKWLGKKSTKSGSSDNGSKEGSSSTKNKSSSSSSKEKSTKKLKLSKCENKERSRSPSPKPMDIVMPSKEELEILRTKHQMQREENKKMKALLEKINIPAPKQVEHLSLRDMSLNELLNTYASYKEELDEVFEKNCKKDHVKGNDGINHCVVIGLIDQQLQLKMMEKLTDIYSSNINRATHATLYANALLPEWIVRIFMKKYGLSRSQAIEQIQNQEAYKSYMEDQNESSLHFDD